MLSVFLPRPLSLIRLSGFLALYRLSDQIQDRHSFFFFYFFIFLLVPCLTFSIRFLSLLRSFVLVSCQRFFSSPSTLTSRSSLTSSSRSVALSLCQPVSRSVLPCNCIQLLHADKIGASNRWLRRAQQTPPPKKKEHAYRNSESTQLLARLKAETSHSSK